MEEQFISTTEYARIVGVSPKTIYRRVQDGTLTPDVIGPGGQHGAFLFKKPDTKKPAAQ